MRRLVLVAGAMMVGLSSPSAWTAGALPSGSLRAAYISANTAQAVRLPDGTFKGVSVDVASDIAHRLGLRLEVFPVATASEVLDAVRTGRVDIGFVAPNPARMGDIQFSPVYMTVGQSAMVLAGSPLKSVAELDTMGTVIGINSDDSVGVWLKGTLKHATVVETGDYSLATGKGWLLEHRVAALAGGRQRLKEKIENPDVRMLDDNFDYRVPQAVAVRVGNHQLFSEVNAEISEARQSGAIERYIQKSGISGLE